MLIPETDEELLAECEIETFRSSGPGGQNVNRRETAVRLRHRPTGLVVVCQQERSQLRNRRIALALLRARLEEMARPPRKRVPTEVPRSVRRRRLALKRARSRIKEQRKKPHSDE